MDYKVNDIAVERNRTPKRMDLHSSYVKSFEEKANREGKEEKENA